MNEPAFIQLVADYGVGDPAFGEVIQKLQLLAPGVRVHPTSVPAFSTLSTGFWTYQYAMVNALPGMGIYTNTAPRKDRKESRENNEGERLVYAKLKNGVQIIGVNAGYCFSFVKPFIAEFVAVNVANKGSQFRSRDFYPEAVIGILRGDAQFHGNSMPLAAIPDVPQNKIAWIDGYGNIKTSVRRSALSLEVGKPLTITLNGMKRTAFFSDGTFAVREGELAFSPGSSGGDDKFMEIFLRGLSAWKEFGKPHVEDEFSVGVTT